MRHLWAWQKGTRKPVVAKETDCEASYRAVSKDFMKTKPAGEKTNIIRADTSEISEVFSDRHSLKAMASISS